MFAGQNCLWHYRKQPNKRFGSRCVSKVQWAWQSRSIIQWKDKGKDKKTSGSIFDMVPSISWATCLGRITGTFCLFSFSSWSSRSNASSSSFVRFFQSPDAAISFDRLESVRFPSDSPTKCWTCVYHLWRNNRTILSSLLCLYSNHRIEKWCFPFRME